VASYRGEPRERRVVGKARGKRELSNDRRGRTNKTKSSRAVHQAVPEGGDMGKNAIRLPACRRRRGQWKMVKGELGRLFQQSNSSGETSGEREWGGSALT